MKKTALFILVAGILIAVLTYIANLTDLIGVKSFFKLGFLALTLMVISAGYFLISSVLEWAKETEFFKKVL
ncbi:hypothetical protein F0L74_32230 [Chitinophaga agrisoli]|uniref:Uncharacterized protein n=1 Tax=Chitinophaga agrisoli TaxID=2607653 RepID=A0A5B2VP23_9BACT|nr:hypothetical protein [Chitinophaga agrisoli]KAA2240805.1 hypothetical protein F0L74_32230 [Chitinophaga agrisoli]